MGADGFDSVPFRSHFPALKNFVYVNTPAAPPGARPILDALRAAESTWEEGGFTWRMWEEEAHATRPLFGELIGGAGAESIALLPSLSEAAATVALSLPAGRIVVGENEFRSNFWPWLANEARGCEIVRVAPAQGAVSTESLIDAIIPGTLLVTVSAVQSSNGYRVDLEAVAERVRQVDAQLFVNLTQYLGALQFDIKRVRPDYVAAHGYKWMLAPRGATWLYVRPDRLERMTPLAPNWKSSRDPYSSYYGGDIDLAATAAKLDASLAWFPWVGARAALDLLLSLDREAVESRCLELAGAFYEGARERGFELATREMASQIVSVRVRDPDAVLARLHEQRVVASLRDGRLRVGFHAFNDLSDVDACLQALGRSARSGP